MRFSLTWLRDFLETKASVDDITQTLTRLGLEVEGLERTTPNVPGVVVAKVLHAEKHPDADRLKVCKVDYGDGETQIVCGAPNVRTGLTVAVATPGTTMPEGFKIKKSKIRGQESNGMICSQRELGIGDEHNGIWELPVDQLKNATPGTPLSDAMGPGEVIFDLGVTPNRGDALSVAGIARDLAAAGLGTFKAHPAFTYAPAGAAPATPEIASDDCTFFAVCGVRDVAIGESPAWLKDRLQSAGLRPINAAVDIGNYVMLSLGQPLHLYDADKVTGPLRATTAKGGETFTGLDGGEHTLHTGELMIADSKRTLGLAGIVGGEESATLETTKNILIEAAHFSRSRIALSGQAHQIHTDARARFERGIDPTRTVEAAQWAAALVVGLCGGTAQPTVNTGTQQPAPVQVTFDPAFVGTFGGLALADAEVQTLLEKLGYGVEDHAGNFRVTVPPHIHGTSTPEDLVEDILRLKGYDAIEAMLPPARLLAPQPQGKRMAGLARRHLATRSFFESLSYSFISEEAARLFGGGDASLKLTNPIDAATMSDMRPSLLPGVLAAAGRNLARGEETIRLAEVGTTFHPAKGTGEGAQKEVLRAAGVLMGPSGPRHWHTAPVKADVFTVKAEALALVEAAGFNVADVTVETGAPAWYHPGRSGQLKISGSVVGHFGELHPATQKALGLKQPAQVFELDLTALAGLTPKNTAFSLSPYQATRRDFAFVVDAATPAEKLLAALGKADSTLVQSISLFDVYVGDKLPAGKKSLAVSLTLQAADRTLTEADITAVAEKVVASAKAACNAELRA